MATIADQVAARQHALSLTNRLTTAAALTDAQAQCRLSNQQSAETGARPLSMIRSDSHKLSREPVQLIVAGGFAGFVSATPCPTARRVTVERLNVHQRRFLPLQPATRTPIHRWHVLHQGIHRGYAEPGWHRRFDSIPVASAGAAIPPDALTPGQSTQIRQRAMQSPQTNAGSSGQQQSWQAV